MSSAGGFKLSENRAVVGDAGFSCKRSSVLGTLLVVVFGWLAASGGGPSVSSGTKFASGSSSAVVFSSASVDRSTVAGAEEVPACATIIGAEKLSHTPRKRASGRTACPSLGDLIEARGQSVSCGRCLMFCEARLSMDCARVKELQGGDVPPLVVRRPGIPTLARNCQRNYCRYQKTLTV